MTGRRPQAGAGQSVTAPDPEPRLRSQRAGASRRLAELEAELASIMASPAADGADDEHDAEGPTIAYERSRVTSLLQAARRSVDDLDRALERLASGSYGRCAACGHPIPPERLSALPTAGTCLPCARAGAADRERPPAISVRRLPGLGGYQAGDLVRIKGERGNYTVRGAARSAKSPDGWLDLYGGPPGRGAYRSVGTDRVTLLRPATPPRLPLTGLAEEAPRARAAPGRRGGPGGSEPGVEQIGLFDH
ncbi:MAG: TraR/DksA family transcriptional regulator [Acidimicrobiales bacterium]